LHVWAREEACTGFWWGNPKDKDNLKDPSVDGRIILRYIFRKWDVGSWTGLLRLGVGTSGGYL
jgi:hypothetical protein